MQLRTQYRHTSEELATKLEGIKTIIEVIATSDSKITREHLLSSSHILCDEVIRELLLEK